MYLCSYLKYGKKVFIELLSVSPIAISVSLLFISWQENDRSRETVATDDGSD